MQRAAAQMPLLRPQARLCAHTHLVALARSGRSGSSAIGVRWASSASAPSQPLRPASTSASTSASASASASSWAAGAAHLGPLSRLAVAAGAAVVALADPARGDCVALATELTARRALLALRARVRATPAGAALLAERPARLSGLPAALAAAGAGGAGAGSLGAAYAAFMSAHGLDAADRAPVRCLPGGGGAGAGAGDGGGDGDEDAELAWLLQRARDAHDVWHVLAGLPPSLAGELALKAFEAAHLRLPAAVAAAAAAPLRLAAAPRADYLRTAVPWALRAAARVRPLLAVRYEDLWRLPLDAVRADLRFEPAPALVHF